MSAQEEMDKVMDELQVDGETESMVKDLMGPIIGSAMFAAVAAAAMAVITMLSVTNYKNNNVTGDTEYRPTENEANMNKVEVAAKETDGNLSKDEVTGVDGNLAASQLEGHASTGEATALESGATAARAKAGAADIETKGLKIT